MTGTIANIIEISIKGEREKKKVESRKGAGGQGPGKFGVG
jgi:hypothetical protein